MSLHATKEVQVKPYDRGKLGTNGLRLDSYGDADNFGRSYSSASKRKLSVDQYSFLENKDNYRSERKRDAIPKIERELTDAYIDSITRTPRYGLGRHKTYDEILLSMSTDDPFGKNYQSSASHSNEDNSTQKSKSSQKESDSSSTKPISKTTTTTKGKDDVESSVRQTPKSTINKEIQSEESPRKEKDKETKDKKREEKKTSSKSPNEKNSSGDHDVLSAGKVTQEAITSRKTKREKSNMSVSSTKQADKTNRKVSQKNKIKPTKKCLPRKSRIPVLLPKLFDGSEVTTCHEYKYQPLGMVKTKNSKIPVLKRHSLSDVEKRRTLVTTNRRMKAKFKNNLPSGDAVVNSTFSNSPRRSIESHIYGSSLGSPWRRAESAQGDRSNHTLSPIDVSARNSAMSSETASMSSKFKSMTLNECDYKELREITSLAFGQKSKTMFDDYRTFGYQDSVMIPKREHVQPKIERELSDAYIESISRTPRYGLGRHKTYDEIFTSLSQADPFNGNYQPSGITPTEKTNVSLKRSPNVTNQSTEHTVKSKSKG